MMRKALFALVLLITPAAAQNSCDKTTNYAVLFKLQDFFGEQFPTSLSDLTSQQLGDQHWLARKTLRWSQTLPFSCVRQDYEGFLNFYLSNLQAEAADRRKKHNPDPDPSDAKEQDAARLLLDKIPGPPP